LKDPKIVVAAALLFLSCIIPLLTWMNLYILEVLTITLIFIIYSSAWNLLALSGQASLGHAAFFGIGGYVSGLISTSLSLPPLLSLFLGGAISAGIGLLIGLTCVNLREWFLGMVTFGFALIVQTIMVGPLAWLTGGWENPVFPPRLLSVSLPVSLSALYEYYLIMAFTLAIILLIYWIKRSRFGLAFIAIRENELEAKVMGIDVYHYRLLAFVLSSYLAGVAGALWAHHFGVITPDAFGLEYSFSPILYCILGGLGTVEGPILGTVVIDVLREATRSFGWTYERFILIGAILILVVIFMPKGLISMVKRGAPMVDGGAMPKGRVPLRIIPSLKGVIGRGRSSSHSDY
jgi:branched-chain amino acid transport system permease protein